MYTWPGRGLGAGKGVIINDIHEHNYKQKTIWAEHSRTGIAA